MPEPALRLVLDTNVLLAGVVSSSSASRRILDALTKRFAIPLISPPVMAEYREVLLDRDILTRFKDIAPRKVKMILHRLRYIGDEFETARVKFRFDRDPDDATFVELAIGGGATHIISLDADLLSLRTAHTDDGKRFRQRLPHTKILKPREFLDQHPGLLDIR